MSKLIELFRSKALFAQYNGKPAKLLPITDAVMSETPEIARISQGLQAQPGFFMASWTDDSGKRRGEVIDPMAANDLSLMIKRNDGSPAEIPASKIENAIAQFTKMMVECRVDRASLDERNAAVTRRHQKAVEAGDVAEDAEVELIKPIYAADAFANASDLLDCVKARLAYEAENTFGGMSGVSDAAIAEFEVTKAERTTLTADELERAQEAYTLRMKIAKMSKGAAQVAEVVEPDMELVSEVFNDLPTDGYTMDANRMSAMRGNSDLMKRAFAPFTTMSPMQIQASAVSSRNAHAVMQELARFEDKAWGQEAIETCTELLRDVMPSYNFKAKLFSRDGADILMVGDHSGMMLYSWDANTRVNDFDRLAELKVFGPADVPTDAELASLREQAEALSYDNGDEIDFSFDDPEDVIEMNP